jgi:hypothetical protein
VFFADLPEPAPEEPSTQRYFDHPWSRPEHWLPGTANVAAVIGRSEHTAVRLVFLESFPRGVFFEVRALLSPEGSEIDFVPHRPTPFVSDLRLGMRWPDGRQVESSSHWHPRPQEGETSDALHLSLMGGGGGGLSWSWNAWLWPLPPAGPVEVFCRWDEREIAETCTVVDLTPVVDAADDAEELWPLPPYVEGGAYGWTSYSPLGSTFSALQVGDADPSGDGPDAGDEDG